MSRFILNILIALGWAAIMGELSMGTLGTGFVFGYLILLLAAPVLPRSAYTDRVWRAIGLGLYFIKELVVSSLIVARDVLRPGFHMHSGVIAVPLDVTSDIEITMFANMISLTPGTLSIEISDDRKTLYVHAMYLDPRHIDQAAYTIKTGLERRILQLFH